MLAARALVRPCSRSLVALSRAVHTEKRIASLGYNCLLLIGVLEHGYYASFGYQVTSYFAPAARFGAPSELQALIDAAHALGLGVLLELVHSHASSNTREGLSSLDGNDDGGYFVAGRHQEWGSRLFDFAKVEVRRFLLANLAWWATAYRVDGFRFGAAGVVARAAGERGSASEEAAGCAGIVARRASARAALCRASSAGAELWRWSGGAIRQRARSRWLEMVVQVGGGDGGGGGGERDSEEGVRAGQARRSEFVEFALASAHVSYRTSHTAVC